ncbi:MAG: hypothetical protein IJS74_03650 [Clostridia bacterium]|nr:hypothetical protein [Clostridia bacterium]
MAALTKEGIKNIRESIIGDDKKQLIQDKIAKYYISIEESKGKPVSEKRKTEINNHVQKIVQNIKYTVIPINVGEFNINSFISKQPGLTTEQKTELSSNAESIMRTYSSKSPVKIFKDNVVEAFGYKKEDLYIKEPGMIMTRPGPKYEEFMTLMKNIVEANTDPTNDSGMEHNINVIAQEYNKNPMSIQNYFSQLRNHNSGGYCNQRESYEPIEIVINAGGNTAISTVVHETMHAMSYHSYPDGSCKSGFNTSAEKNQYGYRKYQLFNEVVNEYLTRKVMGNFSDEDCAKFGIHKESKNVYQQLIPLVSDMLDKNENLLVDCLLSNNPMKFKEIIGQENFETIVDKLTLIDGKFNFKYYGNENQTLIDLCESKMSQNPNFQIGDEKFSISSVKNNLDFFKSTFSGNKEIMEVLNAISDLDNTCKKVNSNNTSFEME